MKMNNDLISRSKLIQHVNEIIAEPVVKGELYSYEVYNTVIALIEAAPAVDVESVQSSNLASGLNNAQDKYYWRWGAHLDGGMK